MSHARLTATVFLYLAILLAFLAAIPGSYAQENQVEPDNQVKKLYVLDAGNNREKPQVLVVDLSNGKVIRTYRAGYQPDMALSPDGKQLYVASSYANAADVLESFLDIYDTVSGALIGHIVNPEALQHKIPVYGTTMAMSPSGKNIYMEKYHWTEGAPGPSGCYTGVFDTQSRRFLVNISVSNCGHVVLPANEDQTFYVVSTEHPTIDVFAVTRLSEGGINTSHQYVPIELPAPLTEVSEVKKPIHATTPCEVGVRSVGTPSASNRKFGPVFLRPQEKSVGFVLEDGSRLAVDLSTTATTLMGKESGLGKWSGVQPIFESSSSAVYFGTAKGTNSYVERYDQIVRIDPATMATTGTMTTSLPFFVISRSRDDSTLFAVNPERATITVIDALGLKEMQQFSVGVQPILVIAAP